MTTPHRQQYEEDYAEEIARIKSIPDPDLAKLRIWQVMELALPYGLSGDVADTLDISERTVRSWRVNPDLLPNDRETDPSGRRGPGHHYNLLLLAVNGVFPPGAWLLLRWQALKAANGQAIQGYDRMEAVMELAEGFRVFGEKLDELQAMRRTLQEQITAIVTGITDTTWMIRRTPETGASKVSTERKT